MTFVWDLSWMSLQLMLSTNLLWMYLDSLPYQYKHSSAACIQYYCHTMTKFLYPIWHIAWEHQLIPPHHIQVSSVRSVTGQILKRRAQFSSPSHGGTYRSLRCTNDPRSWYWSLLNIAENPGVQVSEFVANPIPLSFCSSKSSYFMPCSFFHFQYLDLDKHCRVLSRHNYA